MKTRTLFDVSFYKDKGNPTLANKKAAANSKNLKFATA